MILREDLKLRLRGAKPATLEDATCWIPSRPEEAKSLNHAYRLVSEKFEPQRLSHSGNVFKVGYYFELSHTWTSLDGLRSAAEASVEMTPRARQAHTSMRDVFAARRWQGTRHEVFHSHR